ncbi:MAG: methylated-DNA--[protein]-cysteine S-methyltransferase [Treponema sp.]|jgi:methylated-DNA-[protein]-cysteine S-methyltransferase|nr:methylated-DNA--[protein]-cysteine S-methyltransferase [Treponema sp.]
MSQTIYTAAIDTPLGAMRAFVADNTLVGLWFTDRCLFPTEYGASVPVHPLFSSVQEWLDVYFAGQEPSISISLKTNGTPFQETVWALLKKIPYGKTVSYGGLAGEAAASMGVSRMSAQAVGGAVGRNPLSLIIPCHRVVGKNGELTGYGGGLERKSFLLQLERREDISLTPSSTAVDYRAGKAVS